MVWIPEYVPAKMDGIARMTKAIIGGNKPMPNNKPKSVISPNVGRARAAPVMATTKPANLPVWPIDQPAGIAMTAAMATAMPLYCRCSRLRPNRSLPASFQVEPLVSQVKVSWIKFMPHASAIASITYLPQQGCHRMTRLDTQQGQNREEYRR